MTQDPRLAEGAGSQGRSTTSGTTTTGTNTTSTTSTASGSHYTPGQRAGSETGYHQQDDQYRSQYSGREVIVADRSRSTPSTASIVGATIAGAIVGGAIPFMLSGRSSSNRSSSSRSESETVEESITVNRPARELYDFWRDFTNFSQFMDNIKSVTKLDERRSHWVIKAPAGTSVEFDSYITEDQPGRLIAWRSEEGASVPNRGRVEFIEQGGSTLVRTRISYDPPAGAAGRMVAKLFQREPGAQARQDLSNFKELMEGRKTTA
jgi:uncharacterized membrane protein